MLRLAGVFFPWALSCLISSISVYLPLSCFICSRLARVCSSVSARCFNSPWILWSYAYQFVIRRSASAGRAKQFVVSGIAPIQLPARKSTLSETIRQRPMRAGCWRFHHANDDKVTACGFRNDVRSRKVAFRPTVWLFREFSVRIINMNGHLCMIDFFSQPEPIFIPFKQFLPHRFPLTRSEVACPVILAHVKSFFYIGFCRQKSKCPRVDCGGVHPGENRRR